MYHNLLNISDGNYWLYSYTWLTFSQPNSRWPPQLMILSKTEISTTCQFYLWPDCCVGIRDSSQTHPLSINRSHKPLQLVIALILPSIYPAAFSNFLTQTVLTCTFNALQTNQKTHKRHKVFPKVRECTKTTVLPFLICEKNVSKYFSYWISSTMKKKMQSLHSGRKHFQLSWKRRQ